MRVIVPFGPRKIMGFVVERTSESEFSILKEVIDVQDLTPALTEEPLDLGKWPAHATLCMYITAFQAMLPQVSNTTYKKEIVRMTEEALPVDLECFFAGR